MRRGDRVECLRLLAAGRLGVRAARMEHAARRDVGQVGKPAGDRREPRAPMLRVEPWQRAEQAARVRVRRGAQHAGLRPVLDHAARV
jgi:hypothetical protein